MGMILLSLLLDMKIFINKKDEIQIGNIQSRKKNHIIRNQSVRNIQIKNTKNIPLKIRIEMMSNVSNAVRRGI